MYLIRIVRVSISDTYQIQIQGPFEKYPCSMGYCCSISKSHLILDFSIIYYKNVIYNANWYERKIDHMYIMHYLNTQFVWQQSFFYGFIIFSQSAHVWFNILIIKLVWYFVLGLGSHTCIHWKRYPTLLESKCIFW